MGVATDRITHKNERETCNEGVHDRITGEWTLTHDEAHQNQAKIGPKNPQLP